MSTAEQQREYRKSRYIHGPTLVPSLGSQRRIQALVALGWSVPRLERLAGVKRWVFDTILKPEREAINREMAARISALFDQLWDKRPPARTTAERISVSRSLTAARKAGWVVPLAWDDIDDPNEVPQGVTRPRGRPRGRPRKNTAEEYEFFKSIGMSDRAIAERLGIAEESLYVALRRARQEAAA